MRIMWLVGAILLMAGTASAGSRDAPEVPDAEGDCAFAAGNEYADITAAWISEETATDILVNIELAKWTHDAVASYAGYTLQFTHQEVQWGVVAYYDPQNGWIWRTGQVDRETSSMSSFNETSGRWDEATATMSMIFPKSLFPHTGDDDKLRGFSGGSADLKKDVPFFLAQGLGAPVPSQEFLLCDLVESAAEYTFTLGQHTLHRPTSAPATSEATPADDGSASSLPPAAAPPRSTPGLGPLLGLVVLACLAASRRRS